MAFTYDIENKESKFNAGIAQTYRIHETLQLINQCKLNPLAWNMDYSEWNYNLWFRGIVSVYDEIASLINETEKQDCENLKISLTKVMKSFPVHENKSVSIPNRPNPTVNENSWEVISKYIEKFELMVKELGLKYKILSTTKEERGRI